LDRMSLIFAIICIPNLIYAGSNCEVVSISLYNNYYGSGGVVTPGGVVVGTNLMPYPCARVTIKYTGSGSRLGGKIIVKFKDGKTKIKRFHTKRIHYGELYTTNICWSRKLEFDSIDCEFKY